MYATVFLPQNPLPPLCNYHVPVHQGPSLPSRQNCSMMHAEVPLREEADAIMTQNLHNVDMYLPSCILICASWSLLLNLAYISYHDLHGQNYTVYLIDNHKVPFKLLSCLYSA